MKKVTLITVIFLLLQVYNIHAQYYGTECGMLGGGPASPSVVINGDFKPVRSDMSNGVIVPEPNDLRFPILILFVQFKDEVEDSPLIDWHPNQAPGFLNSMITLYKTSTGNFYDRYNNYLVSDWWHEVSHGKMHVTGQALSIILDSTAAHYLQYYPYLGDRETVINKHIWQKVSATPGFDWTYYDKWEKNNGLWEFGDGESYIDMIYKVHRTNPKIGNNYVLAHYEGYGYLAFGNTSYEYPIPGTNKKIRYDCSELGSGLTLQGHDRSYYFMDKSPFMHLMAHEHGHFLFGSSSHIKHAKMNYASSRDFFFSPWEKIKFGYVEPEIIDYESDNHTYILNDFSGRDNSNPVIFKLPIRTVSGFDEYFLISSRRKLSQWDVMMVGDTAKRDPMRNINPNYGKGLYIYHVPRDLDYSDYNKIDLECADGLWNWQVGEPQYPDWSNTSTVPYIYRNTVDYTHNDNVNIGYNSGTLEYSDGITAGWFSPHPSLFSIGKKHTSIDPTSPLNEATDRIFTNSEEKWTSWEFLGDRYDAWEVGYNEIFSPWSSPSTRNWDHEQTGIYIWYKSVNQNTNQATLDIYKVSDGMPEYLILELTPPSRPMGIKNTYVDPEDDGIFHPKISWNHNMEPDMQRDNGKKMYIVYRALADNMNQLPGPYYVRAALEINANSPAEYTDTQIIGEPSILPGDEEYLPFPLRYRVVAVDKHNDYSVPSDFATAIGLKPEGSSIDPGNGDKLVSENGLPKEYNLFQNYPNPFNPVTNIQFDLPKEGLVTLKVYDILGREVKNLVTEFKQAGSYIVSFDGSKLSSGIYFYRLETGDFVQVKRMILIK